jgi:HIRAN domain
MYCTSCGTALGPAAHFCLACGAAQAVVPAAASPGVTAHRSAIAQTPSAQALLPVRFEIDLEEAEWEGEADEGGKLIFRGLGLTDSDGDIIHYDDLNDLHEAVRVVSAAGASFRPKELALPLFDPGSDIRLVREPENPHSRNAVAMFDVFGEHHLGYVPHDYTIEIGHWVDNGDIAAVSLVEILKQKKRIALKVLIWKPSAVAVLGL